MKRFLTLAKLIPIMVLMMFVGVEAQEIAQYQFKKSVEAWTPIVGTVHNPPRLNSDEGNTNILPIGFEFPFDGRTIDKVVITTNGFVRLGSDASKAIFGPSLVTNNISDNLNPLMLDARSESIATEVTGSIGNRVFTIQWNKYRFWNEADKDIHGTMQVKLYENGNIQFVYGPGISTLTRPDNGAAWRIFVCGNNKAEDFIGIDAAATTTIVKDVNEYNKKDQFKNLSRLTEGTTYTFIAKPLLVSILPNDDQIYQIGQAYSPEQFGPKVNFDNLVDGVEVKFSYRIVTDDAVEALVYRALDPNTAGMNDTTITLDNAVTEYKITRATGDAAGNNGVLDFTTSNANIRAGAYKAIAIYWVPTLGIKRTVVSKFRIAYNKDLEVAGIVSPFSADDYNYENNRRLDVIAKFRNVGVQDIKAFRATAKIFFESETTPVFTKTETYEVLPGSPAFSTNTTRTIKFGEFLPENGNGNYRVEVTAENLTPLGNNQYSQAGDDVTENNTFPMVGTKPYYFNISENVDLMVEQILKPNNEVYSIGLPMTPTVRIKNIGANNIGAPAVVNVKVTNSDNVVIYEATEEVHSVPVRPKNVYVDVPMNRNLIIDNPGTYTVTAEVISNEDNKDANNVKSLTFTITPGISGVFTIGDVANAIDPARNFENFDKALSTLHLKTVAGPVTLLLTDNVYNIERIGKYVPALDFSSKIIGVNEENTITIKAAPAIDTLKNAKVTINMTTESGIGVLFGQSTLSYVDVAPVNEVFAPYKNKYSKSEGYIIIDGGEHKSLEFNLKSNSTFRSAFYLAQGASNITIKNVIINSDANNLGVAANLPLTSYTAGGDQFKFSADKDYTAGILLRSVAPFDKVLFTKGTGEILNNLGLDSLVNTNNVIAGNEINNFNIGIASTGMGVLLRDIKTVITNEDGTTNITSTKKLAEYFNHNNKFEDNRINGGRLAGVFLGFEENSTVKANFISNIVSHLTPTYGILLGNQIANNNIIGYYNRNNKIQANRIFNVMSEIAANGIATIQNKNIYTISGSNTEYVYPMGLNRNIIESNAITGIKALNPNAKRFGINVTTSRAFGEVTPAYVGFRSKADVVANNTIFMNEDGLSNTGIIAAINLMQVNETKVINNLLLLNDNKSTGENALIRLTSKLPKEENLLIDRNVFYKEGNTANDIVRFHQTNVKDVAYTETGIENEYDNLEQWQNWTGMDVNSFYYDFTRDIRINAEGTPEIIKVSGKYPLNSKINNTGYLFTEISFSDDVKLSDILRGRDINGELRGQADSRYDIGANEFFGEVYVRDFEVLKILSPNSYQAKEGKFKDHNYVMTKAPVNVTALIRNNGSMPAKRLLVKAVITRQFNSGKWDSTYTEKIPVGGGKFKDSIITVSFSETYYTYVDVDQYGHTVANFDIGNPDKTPVFVPQTFYELKNYEAPAEYAEMRTNITPLYRIKVEIVDDLDQKPANNKEQKIYRFFVKKSQNDLLVSAENVGENLFAIDYTLNDDVNTDIVAGKLNYDSLKVAFNKLGLYQVKGVENPYYHFDVMDRTLWEPRAFDYSVYNTLFWIDGHDKQLTKVQEGDLREFLDNKNQEANWNYKKSLVVASQEFIRENAEKADFLKDYMSVVNAGAGNPLGAGVDFSGNHLKGDAIAKDYIFTVKSTGFQGRDAANTVVFNDANSFPAAMTLYTDGLGITAPAAFYEKADATNIDLNIAGSTTFGLTRNMIYFGQDWRHFGNGDMLLRGIFDYLDKHGSTLTPVELVDFEAIDRNKNVELSWATASELNSSHFEIEKAIVGENGNTTFQVIATEPAAGKSNVTKSYGPIVDKDVNYGTTYVYRLRSVDQDGSSSLSNEVEVSIDNFFGVSPNPANSNVTYSYTIGEAQNAQIEIYDVTGKMVKSLFNGVAKANDSIQFNVAELANGTYTIVLKTATNTYTTKLSVRK